MRQSLENRSQRKLHTRIGLKTRKGAALVEYALIVAVVATLAAITIQDAGRGIRNLFTTAAALIGTPPTPQPGDAVPDLTGTLTLNSATLPTGQQGAPWTFNFNSLLTVTNGGPDNVTWNTSLNLPGLVFDPNTGTVTGVPGQQGGTTFTVTATLGNLSTTQTYNLDVSGSVFHVGDIAVGNGFTCAINAQNNLYCWGIHTGTWPIPAHLEFGNTPRKIDFFDGQARSVQIGHESTCVERTDNTLWCLGRNQHGHLGQGHTNFIENWTQVTGGWTEIRSWALGKDHLAVIDQLNRVWMTGNNENVTPLMRSAVATNTVTTMTLLPLDGMTFERLTLSHQSACGIRTDADGIWCWGNNWHSTLGQGNDPNHRSTPVQVIGTAGITFRSVSGAQRTMAAVSTDNALFVWGWNRNGEIGIGTTSDYVNTATNPIGMDSGVQSVSVGFNSVCAVRTNREAFCWGQNNGPAWMGPNAKGWLGTGNTNDTTVPTQQNLPVGTMVQKIVVGEVNSCTLSTNNVLRCAGPNQNGQLGIGTTTGFQDSPATVLKPTDLNT